MFFSFVKRWCACSVFLCLSALAFSGCAVTSSGNMLGDAAVLKYSTDQKKFRYVEAGESMLVMKVGKFRRRIIRNL